MIDASRAETTQHLADPPPLDRAEQLATLLATKGLITVDEAATAVGRDRSDLVAEAEAWDAARALKG